MMLEDQKQHQLMIQKLLVSVHFVTLFRDELSWIEKSPSLMETLAPDYDKTQVEADIKDILLTITMIEKQSKLIKSMFWYDRSSFEVMNKTLQVVTEWMAGIERVIEVCSEKDSFQKIITDKGQFVFAVVADVYASLVAIYQSINNNDSQEKEAQMTSTVTQNLTEVEPVATSEQAIIPEPVEMPSQSEPVVELESEEVVFVSEESSPVEEPTPVAEVEELAVETAEPSHDMSEEPEQASWTVSEATITPTTEEIEVSPLAITEETVDNSVKATPVTDEGAATWRLGQPRIETAIEEPSSSEVSSVESDSIVLEDTDVALESEVLVEEVEVNPLNITEVDFDAPSVEISEEPVTWFTSQTTTEPSTQETEKSEVPEAKPLDITDLDNFLNPALAEGETISPVVTTTTDDAEIDDLRAKLFSPHTSVEKQETPSLTPAQSEVETSNLAVPSLDDVDWEASADLPTPDKAAGVPVNINFTSFHDSEEIIPTSVPSVSQETSTVKATLTFNQESHDVEPEPEVAIVSEDISENHQDTVELKVEEPETLSRVADRRRFRFRK